MTLDPQQQQQQLMEIRRLLSSEPTISVLVVEDCVDDAEIARNRLAANGIDVAVAYNSEIAAQLLEHNGFSVVFMDWKLVGKSGLEALQLLKSKGHAHIIILTGVATDQDAALALAHGASAVMAKPLTDEHIALIFGIPTTKNEPKPG